MTRDKVSISSTILWLSIRTLMNVILLFFLVEGFASAYNFSYRLFMDIPYQVASNELRNVTIDQGTGAMEIAALLEQNQIVESKYMFLARVYLGEYGNQIVAGTYELGPGMSPDEICQTICCIQGEDES